MNDPIFLRMQSKAEAKARIQEAFWPTFAAGAIYVLPITALTMLSMLLPFVMENYPIWLDAVLYLVELVFVAPLGYGFGLYCVGRSRGMQVSVFAIFEPLGSLHEFGRALGVSLSMAVRLLPLTVIRVLLIYAVPAESALVAVADILILVVSLAESCLQLAMSAAYNLIYDDAALGSWRAVGEGLALYRGRLFSVFSFLLSFIGWAILASLSMGLLLPYVTAYQNVAFARMTDHLRFPEQDGEHPEWPQ